MTGVATSVAALLPYVDAVQAICLGPQPLTIDGTSAGNWDPLSGSPATEAAIAAAQSHCSAFQAATLFVLTAFPFYLASITGSSGTSGILNDLATISSVVAATSQGVAPTAAQRASVESALSDIVDAIARLQKVIAGMQDGATAFQGHVSADIQALTDGSASLPAAENQLHESLVNACVQYGAGPFGDGICTMITSIAEQMQDALSALQTHIDLSISDESAVVPALSGLQDLFTGLGQGYASVLHQVRLVSDADFGSILQQIDVVDLATYWQDTTSFARKNGLGPPQF